VAKGHHHVLRPMAQPAGKLTHAAAHALNALSLVEDPAAAAALSKPTTFSWRLCTNKSAGWDLLRCWVVQPDLLRLDTAPPPTSTPQNTHAHPYRSCTQPKLQE
jgi:hypothetical protein